MHFFFRWDASVTSAYVKHENPVIRTVAVSSSDQGLRDYISQSTVGTWIADWLVGWLETFQTWVGVQREGVSPFLRALLEDCGYMARATVVLDPIFKRVGLSGKSVIPMELPECKIPGLKRAIASPFATEYKLS